MTLTEDKTVADIVSENIKTAHIFKKYGIDFCCGGGVSIQKACAKKGVDAKLLLQELAAVDKVVNRAHDYDNWELGFLIDHIVNIHHKYVTESIPLILQYSNRVAKVHGHHYTEVVKINELFQQVADELTAHMKKEELVLFPYIKGLVAGDTSQPPFRTVNNPIRMMESEHEEVGNIFKTIAELSNNYTPPPEACNTFRALYSKLEEFEQDLQLHIHLENNILHPKAIALENNIA